MTSALPVVATRPARVPFSACPEKGIKERTPRGGAPARLSAARSPGGWRRARGRREGTSCPVTAGSAIRADPPLRAPPAAAPPRGRTERLVASRHRAKTSAPFAAMPRSGEPVRSVPFEGGRLGWRAQGSRDRKSSEGDQARDGLFARAPSTASETGTCRGEAAAGHPAGTMVLVTFAETKVTRAVAKTRSKAQPPQSAEPRAKRLL